MTQPLLTATPTIFSDYLPTLVHQNILQPRITPAPTPTSCPNALVVQLSTTLLIPNYSVFFAPTPIQSFVPSYTNLADGSLLTPAFLRDQQDANLSLFITGILAMLFARNILLSGDYLRRNKVKKKKLFYALFLSQILAPLALIPVILSYFCQRMSCTVIIILSCLSGTTSLAVLITGILGVKVYKCMNNRLFILIVLGLFQALSTTVVVFDVITTRGIRRLTGSCIRTNDLRFTRYFVILQFLESLFICICFIYVCWKSRGSPAARGRISIQLSMEDLPIEFPTEQPQNVQPTLRGWWDYVPENSDVPPAQRPTMQEPKPNMFKGFINKLTGSKSNQQPLGFGNEKGLNTLKRARMGQTRPSISRADNMNSGARLSLAPSSTSRFSRIGMELFQQVMKDELLYTTFITFNCVVVAVLVIIGVNFRNGLSVTGWIALNWGMVSLLAIHSFGRVIHRHERDALLSHPVTCSAIAKAATEVVNKEERGRKRTLPISQPTLRTLRINTSNRTTEVDPFADTQPLEPNASLMSALDYQEDASSILTVQYASPVQENRTTPRLSDSHFPSSPGELDFPSNLGTPTVSIEGFEVRQQQFSRSLLVSASSVSNYSDVTRSREDATYQGQPPVGP